MAVIQPEDVCNQALDLVGYPRAIGDLLEGSMASRVLLRLYGQVRDETLRAKDWPFARRDLTLTLLKSAGVPLYLGGAWSNLYPIPPFLYEYTYPTDALLIRYIRATPTTIPALDPQPVLFTVASDSSVLNSNNQASKVILTNLPNAIAVYTGQILDPTQWEPMFVSAITQNLAKKIAVRLSQTPDLLKEKVQEAGAEVEMAADREE